MHDGLQRALLAAVAAVLLGAAPDTKAAEPIPWQADRPLTWSDFRGRVPAGVAPERAALAATSLGWSFGYQLEWSRGQCQYRVTEIEVSAAFHPADSWVRPSNRSDAILAHEQGHFDITEIHRLMLEQALAPHAGATGGCEGRNERRISADVEGQLRNMLGAVYERYVRNHERVQADYDRETRHSLDAAAQERWLRTIAAALRGEGWEQLVR
jgi:hypothetical protein